MQELPDYSKARITEAMLQHGDKLTEEQVRILREYYIQEKPLLAIDVEGLEHYDSEHNTIKELEKHLRQMAVRRALEQIELAVDPLALAHVCERMRWALQEQQPHGSQVVHISRGDLAALLRALGEL